MNGLKVKAATHFVIVFAFFNQQFLLLGPPLPEPLAFHQMLSWDTNLVVLGGKSSGTSFSSSLYQLECKGGVFTWKTMETKMAKAKSHFVAFQVPDNFMDQSGMMPPDSPPPVDRRYKPAPASIKRRRQENLDQTNVLSNKLRRRQ